MALEILLGADSLALRRSGVGRMTLEIARALRGRPDQAALRLLVNGRIRGPEFLDCLAETAPAGAGPARGRPALRARLGGLPGLRGLRGMVVSRRIAAAARMMGPGALYHEPNMIVRPFPGLTVSTFNDLSWRTNPEWHPRERVAWIEANLGRTLRRADHFIAISRFTAAEMTGRLGVAPERITVVPLAPSAWFRPVTQASAAPVLARLGLGDRAYFLSVSTLEPRKNFDRLLRAYASLPAPVQAAHPLVIAGGEGWGETLGDRLARELAAQGRLRLLGHVPDADLAPLTARCAAFAYVSLYEGFGLPVLEAMAAGAPLVVSATTATIETAGEAAIAVDPLDVAAIAAGLLRLSEDADHARQLALQGLARASQFSWDRTVDRLIDVWSRLAGDAGPGGTAGPGATTPS